MVGIRHYTAVCSSNTFAELRYQSLHVMACPAYCNYMTSLLYDSKLRTQWMYHNNA